MKILISLSILLMPFLANSQTHTTGGGPDGAKEELAIFCDSLIGTIEFQENEFMNISKKKVKDSSSFPKYIQSLFVEKSLKGVKPPTFTPTCDCNEDRRLELLKKIRDYYIKKLSPSRLSCSKLPERVKLIDTLDGLIKIYEEK